jgi:type 1 fimbria pilin
MKFKLLNSLIFSLGSTLIVDAHAACSPIDGFVTTDVSMTLGRILIKPSMPVSSTPIRTENIRYNARMNSKYVCNTTPTINGTLVKNPTLSSLGNKIYNTNIPGIGIRLSRKNLYSGDALRYPYSATHTPRITSRTNVALADGIFTIEVFKTSQNTGSGALSPGLYTRHYLNSYGNKPSLTTTLNANAITIAYSSCEIQGSKDKVVTLPSVTRDKFKGIGTVAGEQNFNFNILCNGGKNPTGVQASNKISLKFDYTANSDQKSIVNSAPTNTAAKGVSIQLINKYKNANTIINKGSTHTLGTVNSNQTITYNVPLSARYIQTAQTVTTGKVRGLATMTIEYE